MTTVLAAPAVQDATPNPVAMNLTAPPVTSISPPSTTAGSPSHTGTSTTAVPPTTTTTAKPSTEKPTTTAKPTTTSRPAQPTTEPPAAPSVDAEVLAIVNDERDDEGCDPVKLDGRLSAAAQKHSEDMSANDYFSHTSRDGRSFVDRAKAEGYPSPGAENIAQGQRSAESVMKAWMNSPGHRANILNCDLETMGLGLDTDGYYWTQMFGY